MSLPEKYREIGDDELKRRITAAKEKYGGRLVILCHHYQGDDVYDFADFTGDSFKLARDAAGQRKAKYIVFCGVHFMAEAARIVCGGDQRVFLPDLAAGCPMADMAAIDDVEGAWGALADMTDITKVIPVTYMNSTAAIKAFCGINDGAVCTSGNAANMFKWAFGRGEKIFFFPDEHLGRNTARGIGMPKEAVSLWKRHEIDGGLTKEDVGRSRVIVWDGYCHVHTHFTIDHLHEMRGKYPEGKIIVHPECTEDVVMASDASGSTEQIKRYVEAAGSGETIIVGTEINMVGRLARLNGDKKVIPLSRSLCPNMFRISLKNLCWTLEELGRVNEILVSDDVAKNAHIALERMLKYT